MKETILPKTCTVMYSLYSVQPGPLGPHEGRKFAGRFAGKDANCCAFVSQPKQPLVKARSGRLGSERIAAAAVVLLREVGALLQAIHSTP